MRNATNSGAAEAPDALDALRYYFTLARTPHLSLGEKARIEAAIIAALEAERAELTGGFEGENRGSNPWAEVAGEWQRAATNAQEKLRKMAERDAKIRGWLTAEGFSALDRITEAVNLLTEAVNLLDRGSE